MALLDRFRTKPAWQHEDPAVRAAAVRELPGEEQDRLGAIARDDGDIRVRRAAVRKLASTALLAELIRSDDDASVREEAAETLTSLLERSDAADAAGDAALAVLQDPRHLVSVARSARVATLRRAAVERLTSPRALADLARSAEDAEVRLLALERVSETAALADVAARSEHKDVALRAVERLDRDGLKAVASKARNRAASRRAKELLAAAGEPVSELRPAERRARRLELVRKLEALDRSVDFPLLRVELAAALTAWSELAGGGGTSEETERRFAGARAGIEERLGQHDAVLHEQQQREQAREAARAARLSLRDEAAALHGSEPAASLEALQERFAELAPWNDPDAAALSAAFREACTEAVARRQRFADGEAARLRLDAICQELESAGTPESTLAAIRKEATPLLAVATPEGRARYDAVLVGLRERDAAARGERSRAETENQAKVEALILQLQALAKLEAPKLKEAEPALREARERLGPKGLGSLASKRERDALTTRLKEARNTLHARVQELREAKEWAEWANEGVQEELCARAEALLAGTDMEKIARELKDLDERWQRAKNVAKEKAEPLRERWKAAREPLRSRADAYLAEQAKERAANLKQKLELCEQAEALAASSDWVKTAAALIGFQARWKALGPVPQRDAKAVWERFRKACDLFFSRRKEDLARRKDEWGQNLEKKDALCVRAEGLVESTEWEKAAADLKRLQAEWKTVGPVRKNRSEAVWQRFRKACDAFFERYKKRDELGRAKEAERREAECAELESLAAPSDAGAAPENLLERVRQAQAAWREGGAPALQQRFSAAIEALVVAWPQGFQGTDLDPEANRRKRERLCVKVEELALPETKPEPPAGDLAARLKEALASNTMGARKDPAPRVRINEEVDAARSAWRRIGPVPGDSGASLQLRFEAACRRALEAARPRP